jgi:hypothetical protein
MKRILLILIPLTAVACICLLQACKKTNEYPSHVATVSFPVISLNGPQDTTINRNATWSDPGASWHDSITGESGVVKSKQVVNTSTDSAYLLVYTATNKNGFQTSVTRGLGVTNYNGPINIAGGYTVNGAPVNIYQVARALYVNPNADGFGGGDSTVMVIKSDSTLSVGTIYTEITGTTGVPIPETFSQAMITYQAPYYYTGTPPHIVYQPAVIFSYTATILNVPPVAGITFYHD